MNNKTSIYTSGEATSENTALMFMTEINQSAAGAAGLGIIRGKKQDNVEFAL